MNQYLTGEYLEKNPDWHESDSLWKADAINRIMERNKIKPKEVADVGCGSGRAIYELSKRLASDAQLTGFDVSPQAVALAAKYNTNNTRYVCGDFTMLKDRYFDLVLLLDVFEHVEDYIGFLKKIRGKGKFYIFHIPLDMHVQGLIRDAQINARNHLGHLHYFSKATALRTLEDTGYRVMDWFYTKGTLELPSSYKGMRTTLVNMPRRVLFPLLPDLTVKVFGGFSIMVLADDNAKHR